MTFACHAWREIRHNRAFCLFYLINLSLGLFITIDSFKRSVKEQVSMESQKLLGADLAIRARRALTSMNSIKRKPFFPKEPNPSKQWISSP